ncbi:HAMP domain-containing histidine kinase [bacterium]|nr:HAMP domain-containing histidine kinase [bacterium]
MDYKTEKVRYISHEVKNQLSICDLYTEIINRYCTKNGIEDETILKATENIKRAVAMAGNSLLELKSADCVELKNYNLNELLNETYNLSKVYGYNKNININIENTLSDIIVNVDKSRFEGVIINLIKNACEAFKEEENKQIQIKSEIENSIVKIKIINNACPITNPTEIFLEGVTTKSTGSGLGLYIAKNNIEEMSGTLKLLKSDNISTVFEIQLKYLN